jgi:tRNA pseudouridine55 synthase
MLKGALVSQPEALAAWSEAARSTGAVALIDKDEQWTSHDCVARLRTLLRMQRIGHAGTLDPLATGLLIVCIGKATKDVDLFQAEEKEYAVTVKLGATTETDDRGAAEAIMPGAMCEVPEILDALSTFVGEQIQIPPAFSAIKHGRKRQYDLARKGKAFVDKPRVVSIHSISDVRVEWPFVTFVMICSKGTYVRSLARDLGQKLGVGGYVWSLRRTRIGAQRVDDAVGMQELNTVFTRVAA